MSEEQLIPNAVGRLDDVVAALRRRDFNRAADLLDSEIARLEAKREQIRNDLGRTEKAISEVNHFRNEFRSEEEWERVCVACGGGDRPVINVYDVETLCAMTPPEDEMESEDRDDD